MNATGVEADGADLGRRGPVGAGGAAGLHRGVNALLVQQVLGEPTWAKKSSDEGRRGLTALFRSNVNPYDTFRLDTDVRIDLGPVAVAPRPRTSAGAADRSQTRTR